MKGQAEDTVRGEQLALEQAGGRAGAHGDRDSALGRYSIDANGDTMLSTYGVLRISRKRLVYDHTIDSAR